MTKTFKLIFISSLNGHMMEDNLDVLPKRIVLEMVALSMIYKFIK